jgi:hypothetical protein
MRAAGTSLAQQGLEKPQDRIPVHYPPPLFFLPDQEHRELADWQGQQKAAGQADPHPQRIFPDQVLDLGGAVGCRRQRPVPFLLGGFGVG